MLNVPLLFHLDDWVWIWSCLIFNLCIRFILDLFFRNRPLINLNTYFNEFELFYTHINKKEKQWYPLLSSLLLICMIVYKKHVQVEKQSVMSDTVLVLRCCQDLAFNTLPGQSPWRVILWMFASTIAEETFSTKRHEALVWSLRSKDNGACWIKLMFLRC